MGLFDLSRQLEVCKRPPVAIGKRAAAIQSLLATAEANGIQPLTWLKQTLVQCSGLIITDTEIDVVAVYISTAVTPSKTLSLLR